MCDFPQKGNISSVRIMKEQKKPARKYVSMLGIPIPLFKGLLCTI